MKRKKAVIFLLTAVMMAGTLAGSGNLNILAEAGADSKDDIKEFTAFFAVPGTEINDDNDIQQKIAELTGAKVKETWLTGQTAQEAVGTLIAGGEYPDFIDGSEGSIQLYEAGALVALDDYLDDYPNLKNLWSEEEWDKVRLDDGHIYWIPSFNNVFEKDMTNTPMHAWYIQTRVLKWAGYPEIKTMDEYFDLIERYNEANPTMEDGTANIPYTILCDDWRYFCLEANPAFLDGYPNDGSAMVDPETHICTDYNTTPTAKAYYQKLNEEFKKGIVDPESFTQNFDEYIAKLSSGRVLGMVDQWWEFGDNVRGALIQQGLDAQGCDYVPLGLTIDESVTNQYMTEQCLNPAQGIGITESCKDVEGALQFLNDLFLPEVRILRGWGVEGEDYQVDENGVFYRTDEQWAQASDPAYQASHICSYSYLPNYIGLLDDKINAARPTEQPSEFLKSVPQDVQECLQAYGCSTYVDMLGMNEKPGPWYPLYSFAKNITTATEGGVAYTKINEVKHEYLPKVVMADDFESGWEEFLGVYEDCNPKAYIEELQGYVDQCIEEAKKYE